MAFRFLSGFDSHPFLERLEGTDRWGYSQGPAGIDADDVLRYDNSFEGTDLYLIDLENEKIYQPFPKEKMVYLEEPVYDPKEDCFGLIRYDFTTKIIGAYSYRPLENELTLLTQLPMEKGGDLINLRLLLKPWTLVKHDMQKNQTHFLWPFEASYQWEENEHLNFIDENYFYTSKWVENPDYYEEVRLRDRQTGDIKETYIGSIHLLNKGDFLILTQKNQP